MSLRSGGPKVYRQSDPTGVRRKEEGPQIECSNQNKWNPFFFFLPSIILTADHALRPPVSTTESLPVSSKTAPAAEILSF